MQNRVSKVVEETILSADAAQGLAKQLAALSELIATAPPEELRNTATGLRSAGVLMGLTALTVVGLSERLATLAAVKETDE